MKKVFLWLLISVLLGTGCAFAQEATVPQAGSGADASVLAQQAVYVLHQETGAWSARTYQAEAVLDWFWEEGSRNSSPAVLAVELEGNADTGLMTPVLRVYHQIGKEAQPMHAVSILVGETRYDFAAVSATVQHGSKQAEVLSAPLNSESLAMLDALIGCEAASVRLIGETAVTTEISSSGTTTRQRIEYAALQGMAQAKTMLQQAGVYEYGLWDLNAAAWEMLYGATPAYQAGAAGKMIGTAEAEDAFGMVVPGETGAAATAAQQMLCDAGFLAGAPEKSMNDRAVAAVMRAQKHYGLIPTGCMDGKLAQLLAEGAASTVAAEAFADGVQIGGVVEISLDRWWRAEAVQAQYAEMAERTVTNRDRVLVVADGRVENLSNESIRFMIEAQAQLVLNGQVRYEAILVCECDGGKKLDTQLMAREAARLIVYAEIPQQLLEDETAVWMLEVTAGGETAAFMLK